jgi:hypothetical protein
MPGVPLPSDGAIISVGAETTSSRETSTNPFDATSGHEDEHDDEWWNDEESIISKPKNLAAISRVTRWPTVERRGTVSPLDRRQTSSVRRPTREKSKQRQKKQNAKAGIKVITDFSQPHGPAPILKHLATSSELPRSSSQASEFVDLAALQALDIQAPNAAGGLWKSIKGIIPSGNSVIGTRNAIETAKLQDRGLAKDPTTPVRRLGSYRGERLVPAPIKLEADLSPCDRPIVIGISIPSAKLAQHVTSPQTASSDTSKILESYEARSPEEDAPDTHGIVISSPLVHSTWSPLESDPMPRLYCGRATSSVYSRSTNYIGGKDPANARLDQEWTSNSRDSADAYLAEDEDLRSSERSRVKSSCTVFEEDESPILHRRSREISIAAAEGRKRPRSINTLVDSRRSKGWWDAIVTPFLTRSNTLVSPRSPIERKPSLPGLETAAINSWIDSRASRKLEVSFSPKTPETSTTIASDISWEKRNTLTEETKTSEFEENAGSPGYGDEDAGTLPFMLLIETPRETETQGHATSTPTEMLPETLPETRSQATNLSLTRPSDRETPRIIGDSIASSELSTAPIAQPQQTPLDGRGTAMSTHRPQVIHVATQIVINEPARAVTGSQGAPMEEPPPQYSPPRPTFRRYHAVFPPGHSRNNPEPLSPGPISPILQQEMLMRGGIALSDVPLTPVQQRRPINLNSGYPGPANRSAGSPYTTGDLGIASKKSQKVEAKRRRHEKEDALAHKFGGLWRGRGCFPARGCYGRKGAEGRKRRRCYFFLISGFLTMIILILVLALTLHRAQSPDVQQSQWLNLTGFPPIYTGISTISAPDNPVANTGCVFPSTMWSCALPKELQSSVAPNQPNQPNFRLQIQWDNSTAANTSFANITSNQALPLRSRTGNVVSARHFIRSLLLKTRQSILFTPSPAAPSYAEQFFLGNTTDGIVSDQKAGEPTPFFISFLSTLSAANLQRRDQPKNYLFPNVTSFVPAPDLNTDGTAAPANLLPFPVQQPLRLYDRGLPTEHYGFYTYFNRSIFLKSNTPLNESDLGEGEVPDDQEGGARETEATVRCTWAETRFLVQMWTRKNTTAKLVGTPLPSTSISANITANDFVRPGSFPYPVTIIVDRHGGDPAAKLLYCYGLDTREHTTTSTVQQENRGFGGGIINQAPSLFVNNSDPSLGGYDGGSGGCKCQWQNWMSIVSN